MEKRRECDLVVSDSAENRKRSSLAIEPSSTQVSNNADAALTVMILASTFYQTNQAE